jgi:hypothetical protein
MNNFFIGDIIIFKDIYSEKYNLSYKDHKHHYLNRNYNIIKHIYNNNSFLLDKSPVQIHYRRIET